MNFSFPTQVDPALLQSLSGAVTRVIVIALGCSAVWSLLFRTKVRPGP